MTINQKSLEAKARRHAHRHGYAASKSRDRHTHLHNRGGFMPIDSRNTLVVGDSYELTPQDVIDFIAEHGDRFS